jgi:PAS domain S-box-containing protein
VAEHLELDQAAAFRRATEDKIKGRYHGPSIYDGEIRLSAWQQLEDLPLIMTVGRAESDVLAAWRRALQTDIVAAVGTAIVIILLGALSIGFVRRRDQAERTAAEAARQFELIAETATDIIVRATLDGRRMYISPACRDMMGYEPSELVGVGLHDLAHPDDLPLLEQTLATMRDGAERATLVYRGRHRNGHYVWLEVAFRMVRDPETGMPQEIIASTRDISSRKIGEMQLARAKEAAELASRAKSNFLSGMSHELRTPLNAIIGFSDLMDRQMFGPIGNDRYAGYVGDIKSSGEHLLQLINDILDHAKIEAGQLELHEDVVDMAASVAFVIHMLALQAEQAELVVMTTVPAGIRILGDERRIRQILLNLLGNAIKYTPAGGLITVAAGFAPAGDLILSVADTGIGIAESDQTVLMLPFTQIDNERNRTKQGTGLGLALTRQLAELHGGRLTLESQPGKGTTIFVFLPVSRLLARPA